MNHVVDKKITIIVSVLNGSKTLERCLLSIFGQTYETKEIIVIDGFSSDATVDIIKKYSDNIDYWISEPDSGIYNAWNKAIKKSTGEWICFLGCDDWWSSASSLSEIAKQAVYPEFNFVSSKMYLVDNVGNIVSSVGNALNCRKLVLGPRIAHVGALHHRSLFDAYGLFDENYKIAGDYEFILRASPSIKPAFVPKNLIFMGNTGLSNLSIGITINEGFKALSQTKGFGLGPAIIHYIVYYLAFCKSKVLKSLSSY
jgi:glycosyltransferase involved in cell wall biosynthesis